MIVDQSPARKKKAGRKTATDQPKDQEVDLNGLSSEQLASIQ